MKTLSASRFDMRFFWTLMFLAFSILLAISVVQGFENGNVNNFRDQSIQLPIIYSYKDPTLLTGDFLLEARDSYVTWFYPAIGYVSRVVPLDSLMFFLYVLAVTLTTTAIYFLAETLFPGRGTGLFAIVLWMAYFPNPGGDFTHSPFVTHTTFAIAIEMWALVLIMRQRPTGAAILLGIAANINAMTAFFVTFMWLFAVLFTHHRRLFSWSMIRALLLMGVAASPVIWWRFSLPLSEASLGNFVEIVRTRLWYAVFPFSINGMLWLGFFALLAIFGYSFRYGKSTKHTFVLWMIGGIALLSLIGTIFSEVFPVEFMIELQLIRSTWLINLWCLLYLAHLIRALLASEDRREWVFAFALVLAFAIPRLVIEFAPPSQPTPYPLVIDLDPAGMSQGSLTLLVIAFGAALIGLLRAAWHLLRLNNDGETPTYSRRVQGWVALAVIMFTLPAFIDSNVPDEQAAQTADWEDALVWIRENTPTDAQFATPPTLDGFRVTAQRPHLGDWKDGTVGIFHNGWAIEWYERMMDLGFDPDGFSFTPISAEQWCYVVDKYDMDYVLVFSADEIPGEALYANDTFEVLPVETMSCPATVMERAD